MFSISGVLIYLNKLPLEGWVGVPPTNPPPSPGGSGRRVSGSPSHKPSPFSRREWEKGEWESLPQTLPLLPEGVGEGWVGVPPTNPPPSPGGSGRRVSGSPSHKPSPFSRREWEKGEWESLPQTLPLLPEGVGEGWVGVPPTNPPPSPGGSGRRVSGSPSHKPSPFSRREWEKGEWESLPQTLPLLPEGVGEGWVGVPPTNPPPSPGGSGRRVSGSPSHKPSPFSRREWEKGEWESLPQTLPLLPEGVGEGWVGVPPTNPPPSPGGSGRRVSGSPSHKPSPFSRREWEKGEWESLPQTLPLLPEGVGEGWVGVPPTNPPPSPGGSGRRVSGSPSHKPSPFSRREWEKGEWESLPQTLPLLPEGVGEGWVGVPPTNPPPSPGGSGRRVSGSPSHKPSPFSRREWEKGEWESLPQTLPLLPEGVGEGWVGVPPTNPPPSPGGSGRRVSGSPSHKPSPFSRREWEKGEWESLPQTLPLLPEGVGEGWVGVPPTNPPPSPGGSGRRVSGSPSHKPSPFSRREWEKGEWESLPQTLPLLPEGVGEGWVGVPPTNPPPSPGGSGRRVSGSPSHKPSPFSRREWEKGEWESLPQTLPLLPEGVGEGWVGVPPTNPPPSPGGSGRRVSGSPSHKPSPFSRREWEKGEWESLPQTLPLLPEGVGEGWVGVPPTNPPPSPGGSGRRVSGSPSHKPSPFSRREWEKGEWESLPQTLPLLPEGVGEGWVGVPPTNPPPSPGGSGRRVSGSPSHKPSPFSRREWEKGEWESLPQTLPLLPEGVGEGWVGVPPTNPPPSPGGSGRRVSGSPSHKPSPFSRREWEKGEWESLPQTLPLLPEGVGEGWVGVPPTNPPPSPGGSGRRVSGSPSHKPSPFSRREWEKGEWESLPQTLPLLPEGVGEGWVGVPPTNPPPSPGGSGRRVSGSPSHKPSPFSRREWEKGEWESLPQTLPLLPEGVGEGWVGVPPTNPPPSPGGSGRRVSGSPSHKPSPFSRREWEKGEWESLPQTLPLLPEGVGEGWVGVPPTNPPPSPGGSGRRVSGSPSHKPSPFSRREWEKGEWESLPQTLPLLPEGVGEGWVGVPPTNPPPSPGGSGRRVSGSPSHKPSPFSRREWEKGEWESLPQTLPLLPEGVGEGWVGVPPTNPPPSPGGSGRRVSGSPSHKPSPFSRREWEKGEWESLPQTLPLLPEGVGEGWVGVPPTNPPPSPGGSGRRVSGSPSHKPSPFSRREREKGEWERFFFPTSSIFSVSEEEGRSLTSTHPSFSFSPLTLALH